MQLVNEEIRFPKITLKLTFKISALSLTIRRKRIFFKQAFWPWEMLCKWHRAQHSRESFQIYLGRSIFSWSKARYQNTEKDSRVESLSKQFLIFILRWSNVSWAQTYRIWKRLTESKTEFKKKHKGWLTTQWNALILSKN